MPAQALTREQRIEHVLYQLVLVYAHLCREVGLTPQERVIVGLWFADAVRETEGGTK